jgi:hypothetical protein
MELISQQIVNEKILCKVRDDNGDIFRVAIDVGEGVEQRAFQKVSETIEVMANVRTPVSTQPTLEQKVDALIANSQGDGTKLTAVVSRLSSAKVK